MLILVSNPGVSNLANKCRIFIEVTRLEHQIWDMIWLYLQWTCSHYIHHKKKNSFLSLFFFQITQGQQKPFRQGKFFSTKNLAMETNWLYSMFRFPFTFIIAPDKAPQTGATLVTHPQSHHVEIWAGSMSYDAETIRPSIKRDLIHWDSAEYRFCHC